LQHSFFLQATYDAIDATLDKKITEDEPVRGGGNGLKEEKENAKAAEENSIMLAGYKATVRAFGGDPDATIASGTYMIGELGQDGLFLPSSVRDPRSLAQPGNIMDNKINLQEAAAEGTKDWASWMKELKAETVSGKLANPAVQKVRVQLANTIASNERAMASILSDNVGDYDFYADQNQFIAKLQQRIDLQNEVNKNLNKPALIGDALDKFKKEQAEKLDCVTIK